MENETGWFRMSSRSFLSAIFYFYGKWWIITALLFILSAVFLGIIYDIRFIIISLMLLFLIFPMTMAFIYIVYGLREDCSFNVSKHKLIVKAKLLKVEIITEEKTKEDSEDKEITNTRSLEFPLDIFGKYHVTGNSVILKMKGERKGFVFIPLQAFEGDEIRFKKFIDTIYGISGAVN